MPHFLRRALVVLASLLLVIGVSMDLDAASATSDTETGGTLTADNASSSSGGCAYAHLRFDTDSDYYGWTFSGDITDPDGNHAGSVYLTSGSESDSHYLCADTDTPGEYQVVGTFEAYDSSFTTTVSTEFVVFFDYTIRPPAHTAISVSAKRSHAKRCPGKANTHCWLIIAHATKSGVNWPGRSLALQGYAGGWGDIIHCKTNSVGRCGWYIRVKRSVHRYSFRIHTPGGDGYLGAASRVFHMRY